VYEAGRILSLPVLTVPSCDAHLTLHRSDLIVV
jgi:hypothetical protein